MTMIVEYLDSISRDIEMDGVGPARNHDDEGVNSPQSPRSLTLLYTRPPLILNDATLLEDHEDSPTTALTMDFTPPKYVRDMHAAPRFGHTNRLGKLASSNPEDALDYAGGLKQFSLFVIVPFIMWAIILVLFKFLYGIPRIGCAAGGEILDMKQLSKQGISRKQRKKRILRSWRLQTTFMVCGVLVPSTSLLMMQNGWSKVQLAWDEVQGVIDDVESLAFRGWNVMEGLQTSRDRLTKNQLVEDFMKHAKSGSASILFSTWCPDASADGQLSFLNDVLSNLEDQTESLIALFDDYVPVQNHGFLTVTEATHSADQSIQWFFENDWIWKMYIMALNVLNLFLLLCVYIFTKNNLIHPPTRFYLTFFVIPLFSTAAGLLLMVTAISGVATLLNADFCTGGGEQGSPQGTIRDAILSYYHGSVSLDRNMTGTMGLVYDSFSYYAEGCLSEDPLGFIRDYSEQLDSATAYIVQLSANLPNTTDTLDLLQSECRTNMAFLPGSVVGLETDLLELQGFMHALEDLVSCHSISPLIRRLTHGAVCSESANGLTWIWGCSIVVCICCFVMLTTRSALYNSIKKRKKREKKSKRVVEKEFEEYKEFMTEYYLDAPEWKLQNYQKRTGILEIDFGEHIQRIPTLKTERMSSGSDNLSEGAGILYFRNSDLSSEEEDRDTDFLPEIGEGNDRLNFSKVLGGDEMGLADSSDDYDSDYESDSDVSEGSDSGDDESALLSFYTETKSILSETKSILSETKSKVSIAVSRAVANLRALKPLLGKPNNDVESYQGEESVDGESIYLRSPRGGPICTATFVNDYVTPPTRLSVLGLKTPPAPVKPFSFLGRTIVSQTSHRELTALINTPPKAAHLGRSRMDSHAVHPRRLSLSPTSDAESRGLQSFQSRAAKSLRKETADSTKETQRASQPMPSSRLDLVQRPPERRPSFLNLMTRPRLDSDDSSVHARLEPRQRTTERRPSFLNLMTRQRLYSDDSQDISLFIEDIEDVPELKISRAS